MSHEVSIERQEAECRYLNDPVYYCQFNPAQIRFIKSLKECPDVSLMIAGNGSGKSFGLIAILSAIMFGTKNPLFADIPLIQNFPYTKSMRLCAPPNLLEDNGPLQIAIKRLFPYEQYSQGRGTGRGYYSHGKTETGWTFDMMSYHQDAREAAGYTKGLIAFSEPSPYPFWVETVSRTRGEGLILLETTPLNYAPWIKEELIDPGALKLNGKIVGSIKVTTGDIHDNCNIHVGGQLSKEAIERQIALWPAEEREAREKGLFMHLAGRIYTKWGPDNELSRLPAYHQEQWDLGKANLVLVMDPADRRPWAIAYFAIFKNNDVVVISEWPGFSYKDALTSPVVDPEEYRNVIIETEEEIGRKADVRLIDPNWGNSPKDIRTGATVVQMLGGACRNCKGNRCQHSLDFESPPDAIAEGHTLVRRAVGEADRGIRPKLYAMKDCFNFIYGMTHYGYHERSQSSRWKGPSETPELVHKDYPDLVRYLYLAGYGTYQEKRVRHEWEGYKIKRKSNLV